MEVHIKKLEDIIRRTGEILEGNCFYHDKTFNRDDEKFKNKQINLVNIAKGKTTICEIGFNGGHSCLLFLFDNPSVKKFHTFDICFHKYTEPCFEYLKKVFPNVEFKLIKGNTKFTLPQYEITDKYDLVHMDGGHGRDIIKNDIKYCKLLSDIIIIDDTNYSPINQIAEACLKEGYKELDILETYKYKHRIVEKCR